MQKPNSQKSYIVHTKVNFDDATFNFVERYDYMPCITECFIQGKIRNNIRIRVYVDFI